MLALALHEAGAAGVGVRIVPTGAWNRPILAEYDPVLRSIAIDSRVVAGLRAAEPSRMTEEVPLNCGMPIISVVTTKTMNEMTVILCSSVVAPRAPKAVWVLPPPKTERSAPLPCCSRTTRIRKTQTRTCSVYSR